jgi:membrane protein
MPSQTFVTDVLRGLVDARGAIGWIGIGALLWTGSQLFVTLGMAMDEIWQVREKLGFVKNRIRAILLVLLFGVLVALSIGSTVVIDLLRGLGLGGALSGAISTVLGIIAVIISVAFAILMFSVVYKLTPNTHVRWRSALFGGIFAGILWVIARELYRVYLSYANFATLYGSLGSVVILILWIYYSSVILVLGAELAYMNDHNNR